MARTSIYFPDNLHVKLQIASKRKNRSVSQLVTETMSKALGEEETTDLDKLYSAMEQVKGICKDPITDASATINEVLYGEKGAWRGSGK